MSKVKDTAFRNGEILVTLPQIALFFTSVDITDGCWNWIGYKDIGGYGRFCIKTKSLLCHVFSYVLHYGAIPDLLNVLHKCDNPRCVNPEHLWLGTHQENMADMNRKGRLRTIPRKGSASNLAKLTEAQVVEIRKCVELGAKQVDMVKRFGIKASAINSIIKQKTWKHCIQ